jgi:hypothetical protein
MSLTSLFDRINAANQLSRSALPALQKRESSTTPLATLPRMRYPDAPFAKLSTTPAHAADEAYEIFLNNALTPGIAERHIARLLMHADPRCPAVVEVASFAWDYGRESTENGRARVFAHYLVRLQLLYETNMLALRRMRQERVRRIRVLRGCCEVCDRDVAGHIHRLSHPPTLPVPGCLRHGGCSCTYVPVIE